MKTFKKALGHLMLLPFMILPYTLYAFFWVLNWAHVQAYKRPMRVGL